MKKVVHIVEAFGGGIFTFLVDLVNSTSQQFEVVIVYAEREQTPENFKEYFDSNVKFIKSNYLTRKISLKNDILAIKEIKKILKDEKPDVVHLHSSKAGIIGRIAANSKKCKVIYNPHGFSFLMRDASETKRKIYWLIEKMATLRKCTVVGCSQGEYQEAKKLTKNSICINNGVNVEKLSIELANINEHNKQNTNLKVCTVARINYQKNPCLFNEIAKKNPNIQFTWIGDGDLKDVLDNSNIKITGWKSRKEVLNILQKNDVFILTSLWEGLPISLLEAMYMKKLCLVTNVIGNKDVIKNGINGFICNNAEDFEKVINDIVNKKYDIDAIRERAKQDVEKYYDIKKNSEEYIKLYNTK